MPVASSSSSYGQLVEAFRSCRGAFVGVALVSGIINVLYLTGSFFMLEVYDRVLPSGSLPTLVGLAILVSVLYAFQGFLDVIRSRVLIRIGASLDERLSGRAFAALVGLPLLAGGRATAMQPLRDLDQVRSFMAGSGPSALFDLPWMPFYLGICFIFHPLIGLAATVGALLLVTLTLMTEVLSRKPAKAAIEFGTHRQVLSEASRRNAEVLGAMGMAARLGASWAETNARYMSSQRRAADVVGGIGAVTKVLRMLIQSAVLAIGAFLVINQEATGGIIIASAILTARALAPVELAIANWKGFLAARQSWRRLNEMFRLIPNDKDLIALPKPCRSITVQNVSAAPPGTNKLLVQEISFSLDSGQGLGIIGPSASGKSSLARLLVGVWQPVRGKIRLDGAALEQWSPEALGEHIGYLPQTVELFAGSVAQNISRFDPEADGQDVIAAAVQAGVHEMILRLRDGYATEIGEDGNVLSAGQRQRIALARALYKDPFLLVLDEPNSNLDSEGDTALSKALLSARARGAIVIVVAHRPSALASLDTLLVMGEGRIQAFGPKGEVLSKMTRPASASPSPTLVPLKVVGETQSARS